MAIEQLVSQYNLLSGSQIKEAKFFKSVHIRPANLQMMISAFLLYTLSQ